MSDRRVLAASAACITAAIFLFLLGTFPSWKAAVGDGLTRPFVSSGGPEVVTSTQPNAHQDAVPASIPAHVTAAMPEAAPLASPADAPKAVKNPTIPPVASVAAVDMDIPTFDIVRVEPSGDSVVAARAKAGAMVVLLDQGKPIARAQADSDGQVAFVPSTLAPGEHSLMLSVGEPNTPGALSSQSVAVSVPQRAKAAPMVALLQPEQPTRLLSGGPAVSTAPGAAPAFPPVSVGTVDVEEMGSVYATGHARPGSQCRIYLNGAFIANVAAGSDGRWSLKIEHGMRPGHYNVRVDELASTAGDVRARAEVPFDYPARAASNVSLLRPRKGTSALQVPVAAEAHAGGGAAALQTAAAQPGMAQAGKPTVTPGDAAGSVMPDKSQIASMEAPPVPTTAGVPAVVAQLLTTKVIHGDTLWRISRKILGHGRRYTQIYAANTSQIRDPRLIYPGQIFVMPQAAP